jgi:hypothetical protein
MKHSKKIVLCIAGLLALATAQNVSSKGVILVSDQRLKQLLPATVFVDGENVPTQERNAALVQLPDGKVLLASLIDTAGYSSAYQQKYAGVLLSQTGFSLGSKNFSAGAYAFGQKKSGDSVLVYLYNLGGEELAQLATEKQENLRPLKPLQVIAAADGLARLYLGPYYLSLAGR